MTTPMRTARANTNKSNTIHNNASNKRSSRNVFHKIQMREITGDLKKSPRCRSLQLHFRSRSKLFESIPRRLIIPINEIEDKDLHIRTSVVLGFTRCGEYLVGYRFAPAQRSLDHASPRETFAQEGTHNGVMFEYMFYRLSSPAQPIELKYTLNLHGIEFATDQMPKALLQRVSSSSSSSGMPYFVPDQLHVQFTQSICERMFFSYGYHDLSNSNSSVHILSLIPSPMLLELRRTSSMRAPAARMLWGVVLSYHAIQPQKPHFNPLTCIVNDRCIVCPTNDSIQVIHFDLVMDNPTSSNIASSLSPSRISPPHKRDNNRIFALKKGWSPSLTVSDVLLMHDGAEFNDSCAEHAIQHAYINIEQQRQFYFELDSFLMRAVEPCEKLLDYDFKVGRSGSPSSIYVLIGVDTQRDKAIYRSLYHVLLDVDQGLVQILNKTTSNPLTAAQQRDQPISRIVNTTSMVIAARFSVHERHSLQVLNNENIFTKGQSLSYVLHPLLPLAISAATSVV